MKSRLPSLLVVVAVFQFVAPLVVPPSVLSGINVVGWVMILALFALLGVNLLRRRSWSRIATVFIQGLNVIVRLLVLIGHGLQGQTAGNPLDVPMVVTALLSMALSGLILYYVDLPDVQVVMQ